MKTKNKSKKEFVRIDLPIVAILGRTIYFTYFGTIQKATDRGTYMIKDEFYTEDISFKKKRWLFSDKKTIAFIMKINKEDQHVREIKKEYCRSQERKYIEELYKLGPTVLEKLREKGWYRYDDDNVKIGVLDDFA